MAGLAYFELCFRTKSTRGRLQGSVAVWIGVAQLVRLSCLRHWYLSIFDTALSNCSFSPEPGFCSAAFKTLVLVCKFCALASRLSVQLWPLLGYCGVDLRSECRCYALLEIGSRLILVVHTVLAHITGSDASSSNVGALGRHGLLLLLVLSVLGQSIVVTTNSDLTDSLLFLRAGGAGGSAVYRS